MAIFSVASGIYLLKK